MQIRETLAASDIEARRNLKRLVVEHDDDLSALSTRVIGRPPGYLSRYVREGVPRWLRSEEQRDLARYFGVPATTFGGAAEPFAPRTFAAPRRREPR